MSKETKTISASGELRKSAPVNELEQEYRDWFEVKPVAGLVISAKRSEGNAEIENVQTDDVLEILLENDVTLFARRDDFELDFPSETSRGTADGTMVARSISLGPPSRGLTDWAIKLLDVFRVDIADESGLALCKKFEKKSVTKPGLFKIEPTGPLKLIPASFPASHDPTEPVLVFIHGTASSTAGSFGGLWEDSNADLLKKLNEHYQKQVYALEHWSLSQSPIRNAIDLVTALPKNAVVHLVSHSRGGIVGELVCRGMVSDDKAPFLSTEFTAYNSRADEIVDALDEDKAATRKAYKTQVEDLKQFNDLLSSKKIQVQKFVRVACPARGTTLASSRLDRWLSVFFNVIGLVPAVRATPYYPLLKNFIRALVKTRTKAELLPGLEAQMPESPMIGLLNNSERALSSDLTVIAGDIERDGPLGRIALLLPDQFYDSDHDLVVNTPSMYGGSDRETGERFYFDQGNDVSHFNYFRNNQTALRVVNGLLLEGEDLARYFTEQLPEPDGPIASRSYRSHTGPQPVIFLLPGIMGSELDAHKTTIWAKKRKLVFGGLSKLKISSKSISSSGLIRDSYWDLVEYLSQDNEVIPFHYDWRTSLEEETNKLADAIKAKAEDASNVDQPVSIIAHSMGGLLTRLMMVKRPDAWNAMLKHPDSRLVMLGTPNGGSFSIPRMLFGHDKLIKGLALIDLKHSHKQLLDIIRKYPGVLLLLPFGDDRFDYFSNETWQELANTDSKEFAPPDKAQLAEAAKLRTLINSRPLGLEEPGRVLYIAGRADQTPFALVIENNRPVFKGTTQGDGRVPWSTGIPTGIPAWYMDAQHGDLAGQPAGFAAIKELVRTGKTDLLPDREPARARGTPEVFDIKPDEMDVYPDDNDLRAWAMGSSGATTRRPIADTAKINLRITHGNLAYSRNPVMVGHYQNDSLFSAERYLDYCLNDQLTRCYDLGLYPGELDSAELILNTRHNKPAGALIVGLGEVGELNLTKLSRSIGNALHRYAFDINSAKKNDSSDPHQRTHLAISSLLIGASTGGLPLHDALMAIMQGVVTANRTLEALYPDSHLVIDELQIIELWEDRAILAARAAKYLFSVNTELDRSFIYDQTLEQVKGGQSRAFYEEEAGWWNRLQIQEQKDGSLNFHSITNRARTEKRLVATDREKVDQFLQGATASTWTNRTLPKTLFEMLVPNALKDTSDKLDNTIVIVNDGAARYPWELLEDRFSYGGKPLAVQSRLIRQLESEHFRQDPKMSLGNRALVIGEPHLKISKLWAPLPGAADEAERAALALSADGGFDVTKRINTDSAGVLKALHEHSYRVLHLAGHGVHDFNLKRALERLGMTKRAVDARESVSGMVIGDDVFLNTADIEQMRRVPDLVFINCCHLGNTTPDRQRENFPRLAANLAIKFIRMGAKAVVAAGWEVDDDAAKTFADVFYSAMLQGKTFGEAVHQARKTVFDQHQQVNTWGAYQCYGDHQYKLVDGRTSAKKNRSLPQTPSDLMARLENLAGRASTSTDSYREDLLKRVEEFLDEGRNKQLKSWRKRGDVCAVIGNTYGEFDRFDKAIHWYKKAVAREDATVSIKTYEQYANLLVRHAVAAARSNPTKSQYQAVEHGVLKAIKILDSVDAVSAEVSSDEEISTVERECLRGSAYKRLAQIRQLSGAGRDRIIDALDSMRQHYLNAYEAHFKVTGVHYYYPYTNYLQASLILGLMKGKYGGLKSEEKTILTQLRNDCREKDRADPGFWNMISGIDSELLLKIENDSLSDHADRLAKEYLIAKKRAATPREFRSVIENIDFLAGFIDANNGTVTSKSLRSNINTALCKIKESLGDNAEEL